MVAGIDYPQITTSDYSLTFQGTWLYEDHQGKTTLYASKCFWASDLDESHFLHAVSSKRYLFVSRTSARQTEKQVESGCPKNPLVFPDKRQFEEK